MEQNAKLAAELSPQRELNWKGHGNGREHMDERAAYDYGQLTLGLGKVKALSKQNIGCAKVTENLD